MFWVADRAISRAGSLLPFDLGAFRGSVVFPAGLIAGKPAMASDQLISMPVARPLSRARLLPQENASGLKPFLTLIEGVVDEVGQGLDFADIL
jgi:hypothetical protein